MLTGRCFSVFALAALLALPACAAKSPSPDSAAVEPAEAATPERTAAAPAPAAAPAVAPVVAAPKQEFSGQWAYRQSCGWQHSAHLELVESGNGVSGRWDDGTRARGDNGQLQGELRDGRLYLRLCSEGEAGGKIPTCPNYGEASAYLAREGAALGWYRKSGDGYRPYLKLHPAGAGQAVPDDTSGCEEDAEQD
ncbi:hypothetical protein SAMN04487938_2832 [Lysobacter sp. cf310]|nr:hypothetical protein SAMN04487938_2832 [Lysobacter sp. cf310]